MVCREWRQATNMCVLHLVPWQLHVSSTAKLFPLLKSLDLSCCVQVRATSQMPDAKWGA